jgi:hypothetical protein
VPVQQIVVVDVWGGPSLQAHVSREALSIDVALEKVREELALGNVVNLRATASLHNCFNTRLQRQAVASPELVALMASRTGEALL